MTAPALYRPARPAALRRPRPGHGPLMVSTSLDHGRCPCGAWRCPCAAGRLPLVPHQAHGLFCGFTATVPHPDNPAIVQCAGCRLWLPRPRGGAA